MATRKLNLGAGYRPIEGDDWENWDRKTGQEIYPLDCEDNSIDEIRASHVLEHESHTDTFHILYNWFCKLKPGGILKVAVPDFEKVARAYLDGQTMLGGVPMNVQGYTMGGQIDSDDYHKVIFDEETLVEVMIKAGFERIQRWQGDNQDGSTLPVSLNLMGFKPSFPSDRVENTVALLASARFGPIVHHKCVHESLTALNIPFGVTIGCFWHQILSDAIENVIADESVEFVLTLDYDTVFRKEDVLELYRLLRAHPKADAVCALQSKRGCMDALFTVLDKDGKCKRDVNMADLERYLFPVTTGHFGLTLFRADALRALPRPWMQPRPNKDGLWSEGKVDADIDFWLNWKRHGNSLFLAPRVIVGHIEEVVKLPSRDLSPVYMSVGDYMRDGIPPEVQPCV